MEASQWYKCYPSPHRVPSFLHFFSLTNVPRMTNEPISRQLEDLAARAGKHEELFGNVDTLKRQDPQV